MMIMIMKTKIPFEQSFLKTRFFIYKFLSYYRTVLYVLPVDYFRTKSVTVKLVVQNLCTVRGYCWRKRG